MSSSVDPHQVTSASSSLSTSSLSQPHPRPESSVDLSSNPFLDSSNPKTPYHMPVPSARCDTGAGSPVKEKLRTTSKGKDRECSRPHRKCPLQLLDLPIDILKDIIKEVTHTNDLTSLALTHSALHNLAIPQIYNRFDIVWPDAQSSAEPRNGVDALTYGLATLVMREEAFSSPHIASLDKPDDQNYRCKHCGESNGLSVLPTSPGRGIIRQRRGNHFSQYTRKFSLGNGPRDWVQEYLINKEGGKMLGTLVALAIARMHNLESFVWDMPTGVPRDVWLALSSLGDCWVEKQPRLEKLWVRWHDNRLMIPPTPAQHPVGPIQATAPGALDNSTSPMATVPATTRLQLSYKHTEHPNLSIVPCLKSLSVLEMDEPAYFEELSVLVERSLDRLRELRLGLCAPVEQDALSWPSSAAADKPGHIPGDTSLDYLTSGGPLGMIMSKIYDCRVRSQPLSTFVRENQIEEMSSSNSSTKPNPANDIPAVASLSENTLPVVQASQAASKDTVVEEAIDQLTQSTNELMVDSEVEPERAILDPIHDSVRDISDDKDSQPVNVSLSSVTQAVSHTLSTPIDEDLNFHKRSLTEKPCFSAENDLVTAGTSSVVPNRSPSRRLRLETLEMERMPLTWSILHKTIDWCILTNLTLLNCGSHEQLWKGLRRMYSPRPTNLSVSHPFEYRLKLKKIHTDTVSTSLITFLKETLAPNSLETLFLQESGTHASNVSVDAIYRGPLRRHRASLKTIMIDSSDRSSTNPARSQRWKKWIINREVLSFLTSGKLSNMKELAMAVDYKDWHFFLQRLPQVPQLRSLYVPHIADHVYGHLDPRELALQVVDVVALRPEIELCYMGISGKCFEILENRNQGEPLHIHNDLATSSATTGPDGVAEDEDDDESDVDESNGEDEEESTAMAPLEDSDDAESDGVDDSSGDSDSDEMGQFGEKKRPDLKLREILFYDDKVSIFKARHGRL